MPKAVATHVIFYLHCQFVILKAVLRQKTKAVSRVPRYPKGGYVICTAVIPCLSSGLAKNNKIMFMFVLFSRFFGHFGRLAFFENGETDLTPKQSNRMFLFCLSKVQQLRNKFLKNTAILTKK